MVINFNCAQAPRKRAVALNGLAQSGQALLQRLGRQFMRNVRGNAAIELALAMPILLMLSLGGFEMTRYIIIQQKISKTVNTMGNLVARSPSLAEADMTNMFFAVDHLMDPYIMGANGTVILSDVSNNGATVKVNWQRKGGGTYIASSKIGVQGGVATLPAGFTLAVNEDTVISEIYYNYTPLVAPNIVAAKVIYKVKYYKPRLGALTVMNP